MSTKKKFLLFMPSFKNRSIKKDFGLIPDYFSKKYGYESHVLCKKNDPTYDQEGHNLNIHFIKFNKYIDFLRLIFKEHPEILMVVRVRPSNALIILLYKLFFPKGNVYIKCDMGQRMIKKSLSNPLYHGGTSLILFIYKNFSRLRSIETTKALTLLQEKYPRTTENVTLIPNGHEIITNYSFNREEKEDIMLMIARFGSYQKNTQRCLSIAKEILTKNKDWKFYMVGLTQDETDFEKWKDDFFNENSDLKERILFLGRISDRTVIESYFRKAKIFFLTSRRESCGIVLIEGGYYGNTLISTDVGAAMDITNNGKLGVIIGDDDQDNIKIINKLLKDDKQLKRYGEEQHDYVTKNFLRKDLIEKVYEGIFETK